MVHPVHNLSGPRVTRADRSHSEPDTARQLLYVNAFDRNDTAFLSAADFRHDLL